jgi:hypothetical protein
VTTPELEIRIIIIIIIIITGIQKIYTNMAEVKNINLALYSFTVILTTINLAVQLH